MVAREADSNHGRLRHADRGRQAVCIRCQLRGSEAFAISGQGRSRSFDRAPMIRVHPDKRTISGLNDKEPANSGGLWRKYQRQSLFAAAMVANSTATTWLAAISP